MAKILVIEDSPTNMKLTGFFAEQLWIYRAYAVDAEIGLVTACNEQPDLILMDIQLPGMNGMTATALLKEDSRTAVIPIIAYTGLASRSDQEKCLAAGCAACVSKPVSYQELSEVISCHLLESQPSSLIEGLTRLQKS